MRRSMVSVETRCISSVGTTVKFLSLFVRSVQNFMPRCTAGGGNMSHAGIYLCRQVHIFCVCRVCVLTTRQSRKHCTLPLVLFIVSRLSWYFSCGLTQRMILSKRARWVMTHECWKELAGMYCIRCQTRWCALQWQAGFTISWASPVINQWLLMLQFLALQRLISWHKTVLGGTVMIIGLPMCVRCRPHIVIVVIFPD